jgi:hypothetical protein
MYEIISPKSRIINHITIDFLKSSLFFLLNNKQEIAASVPVEKSKKTYNLNNINN